MPDAKGDPGAEDPWLAVRSVLLTVGRTLLATRLELRQPQRGMAARAGVSQALMCAIERGQVSDLRLSTLARVLAGADIEFELVLRPPHAETGRQRDPAHARCVAHVRSRLEQAGWHVATEVEVVSGRSHGWIDVLAYHPVEHVLLVTEIKTEIRDVGAVDRQLGWHVRSAWDAAHRLGWRPRAVVGSLLILATEANDQRLRVNRVSYAQGYAIRARELVAFIADPRRPPRRGLRALAMIDPSSRRIEWLRPAAIDGRRSRAPYRDYADFMAKRGRRSAQEGPISPADQI